MKKKCFLLILLMFAFLNVNIYKLEDIINIDTVYAEDIIEVNSFSELESVVSDLNSNGGSKTVKIMSDITGDSIGLNNGELTLLGDGVTITYTGAVGIAVSGGSTLNVGTSSTSANISMTGNYISNSIVTVYDTSTFNMYDGTTIGPAKSTGQAALVNLTKNGTFNMYGGTLTDGNGSAAGAVIINGTSTFNMYGGLITNCSGTSGGGAVGMSNASILGGDTGGPTFNMYGGTISGNTGKFGGALYMYSTQDSYPINFNMSGGTITNNTSTYYGGGVYAYGNSTNVSLSGGIITSNTASWGGGVYVQKGQLKITGGEITSNVATSNGGGLCLYASTSSITNGKINKNKTTNTSSGRGGAIYIASSSTADISNTEIKENSSIYGGAMLVISSSTVDLKGSTITNNTAKYGGGIYLNGGTVNIESGMPIYNNTASSSADDILSRGTSSGAYLTYGKAYTSGILDDCNHQIDGWYVDSGGKRWSETGAVSREYDSSITGGIYIKAAHKTPYVVTFESNGGTDVDSQTVEAGDTAEEPEEPTKEGYTFNGWYTDEDLTEEYDFSKVVASDMTLYAKWEEITYTVSFDSNGGSEVDSETINYNESATKPEDPTKEGYIFKGWYIDSDLTTEYDFDTIVTENMILYAKWEEITYTVSFDSNGGSEVDSETVTYKGKATKPSDPTKEGYTFKGWYTDSSLTTEYDFNSEVTEGMILYAKWEKVEESTNPSTKDYIKYYMILMTICMNVFFFETLKRVKRD